MAALHQGVENWRYTRLRELRIGQADESIEFAIEDGCAARDQAKSPFGHDDLVFDVIRGTHEQLIGDEVAVDFATSKADCDMMLVFQSWLLESG